MCRVDPAVDAAIRHESLRTPVKTNVFLGIQASAAELARSFQRLESRRSRKASCNVLYAHPRKELDMRRQATDGWKLGTCSILMLLLMPLVGCGDDPVAPSDEPGALEAVVRDGSSTSSPMPSVGPHLSTEENGGEFRADVRVQVEVDGSWQDVAELAGVSTRVELRGGEDAVGITSVEARTYDRVRVVLTNARADVEAGAEIGLGPVESSVTVMIAGGGEVAIEQNAPVTVQANSTTRLILDLNSEIWLTANSLETSTVSRAAFESAAVITVQ